MGNKKISELESRASLSLSDLMAVGDPSTGYLYKTTISDLKTLTGAGVVSFNGRFGAVVPSEGDYTLTQLGDVIITSPSNGQVLKYNGSNWVNAAEAAEIDTFDSVTTRGNTTSNSITVGSVTAAGLSNLIGQIRTFATTGNTYIGANPVSATDSGYKLYVNGSAYFAGLITVPRDSAYGTRPFLQNADGVALIKTVSNNSLWQVGTIFDNGITLNTASIFGDYAEGSYPTGGSKSNYYFVNGAQPYNTGEGNTIKLGGQLRTQGTSTGNYIHLNSSAYSDSASQIIRGIYFNPSSITGPAVIYAFESTAGKIKVSDLSGSGSRMVVADANGVLSTQAIPTSAVSSVFGRTGAVVAANGDYTTSQVTEGTNLYYTDARARAAITLTTTGSSGAATYSGGVLNIPNYGSALSGYVTLDTFQTITASKTFSVGFSLASAGGTNQLTSFANTSSIHSGSSGSNIFGFNSSNNIYFGKGLSNGGVIAWNNSTVRSYTLPNADGTLALTSDIPSVAGVYLPLSGGTLTGFTKLKYSGAEFQVQHTDSNTLALGNWDGSWQYIKSINLGVALTPLKIQASSLYFDGTATFGSNVEMAGLAVTGVSNKDIQFQSTTNRGWITPYDDGLWLSINRKTTDGSFANTSASAASIWLNGASGGSSIEFRTAAANNTAPTTRLAISSTGTATLNKVKAYNVVDDQLLLQTTISGGSATNPFYFGGIRITDGTYDWGAIRLIQQNAYNSWASRMAFFTQNETGPNGIIERMCINSIGNVGIGTTAPGARLVVSNNGALGYEIDPASTSGTVVSLFSYDRSAAAWRTTRYSSLDHRFEINGTTEAMRITSGGYVGIGTSSVSYTLHVQKSISGNVLSMFYNDANSGADTSLITRLGSNCNNTSSYYFTGGIYGVADKIYIYGNGNVVNTNNSYGAISDFRLKENITDTSSKLSDLLKVKIRNYNLIGDDKKQIGVIAQELESIFPSMIETDGKSGMKQVKYSVFVPMLIKAMQEQQEQIEQLKAK